MNYTEKISDLSKLTGAVRSNAYIVGSFTDSGGLSFSTNPAIHHTAAEARKECARLSNITPGKMYVFVQLRGGELVPQNMRVSL